MTQIYKRGFTLIELLVVIAIIGILAGIVLAALGTTRQKGADAGIQGNLDTLRTQAEVYAGGNNNSYLSYCSSATAQNALKAAASNDGTNTVDPALANVGSSLKVSCHDTAAGWAASAPLRTSSSIFWCVDSSGSAATTTNVLAASAIICS